MSNTAAVNIAARLRRIILTVIFLAPAAFSGCGGPAVVAPPARELTGTPAKRVPQNARVPATQRPYRIKGKTYYPLPSSSGYTETGIASWYGRDFHGKKTSNGETFNMYARTAAHKTLPMNTRLLVKNLENGRETVVRVNDRGPFVKGRIIDLTYAAAKTLQMTDKGIARVEITALGEAVDYHEGEKIIQRFLPHQDFEKGDFYVQIGSFTNRKNAERLKAQMIGYGRDTVLSIYDDGSTLFYRVQVHGGETLTAARHMERVLDEAGFPEAFVVAH